MSILDAQPMTAAALVALAAGCLVVLRNPLGALLAVAPLALLVPWAARGVSGEPMAHLSVSAASVWVTLILAKRLRGRARGAVLILAAAAAAAGIYLARLPEAWNSAKWFQQQYGYPYNVADTTYNGYFYIPPLVASSYLLWERRCEWWFWPTAVWAALLLAGAVFLGEARFFQYSLPMQMALVVPLATAAMSRPAPGAGGTGRHPDGGVTWRT